MLTSGRKWFGKLGAKGFASAAVAVAATVGIASVATAQSAIEIDGSSTVFPITEAMAEEFRLAGNNVDISVGVSGTGGGFKKFCAGETVISDASRPIKDSERELCAANGINFIEIPVAYDAITVVVTFSGCTGLITIGIVGGFEGAAVVDSAIGIIIIFGN